MHNLHQFEGSAMQARDEATAGISCPSHAKSELRQFLELHFLNGLSPSLHLAWNTSSSLSRLIQCRAMILCTGTWERMQKDTGIISSTSCFARPRNRPTVSKEATPRQSALHCQLDELLKTEGCHDGRALLSGQRINWLSRETWRQNADHVEKAGDGFQCL